MRADEKDEGKQLMELVRASPSSQDRELVLTLGRSHPIEKESLGTSHVNRDKKGIEIDR